MSAKKKAKDESKDITLNKKAVLSDIKKKIVKLQECADRKLEELTCMCLKEEENGK